MTFAEVEQLLPNGFHDARLDSITIDYQSHQVVFDLEVWALEDWPASGLVPELYRRGRLTLTGVVACSVDVPNGEYQDDSACALWIDVAPPEADPPRAFSWPEYPLPEGAFYRSFYFQNDAASFVRVAATGAEFEWLSEARVLGENNPL